MLFTGRSAQKNFGGSGYVSYAHQMRSHAGNGIAANAPHSRSDLPNSELNQPLQALYHFRRKGGCQAEPLARSGAATADRVRIGGLRTILVIELELTRRYLDSLSLTQAAERLDNCLDAAVNKKLSYPDMHAKLLGMEVRARRER